jgi:enoyl-CoA hydratase/carnithine racemase
MDIEEVKLEIKDKIGLITIDNQRKRNALSHKMLKQLGKVYHEIDTNPRVRCAIITGAGEKAFSTGHDLNEMIKGGYGDDYNAYISREEVLWRPAKLKKPILAAVNGAAYAGGFIIALNCDLRIVSPNATFAIVGAKLGLMVIGGQAARLPRLIPVSKAVEMLLTNKPLSASEAVSLGFATAMAPQTQVVEETIKVAQAIAESSPLIVGKIKECVNLTLKSGMEDALQFELETAFALANHPDGQEGMKAFFEKRKPQFADSP